MMKLVPNNNAGRCLLLAIGSIVGLTGLAACTGDEVAVDVAVDVDDASVEVIVDEAGYSGLLVDSEDVTFEISDDDERFTPSLDDVAAFESALLVDLDPEIEDPADYYRLYYGHRRDEASYLYVSAFCNTWLEGRAPPNPGDFVDDGGDCFWQASFNLETGSTEWFRVNGES